MGSKEGKRKRKEKEGGEEKDEALWKGGLGSLPPRKRLPILFPSPAINPDLRPLLRCGHSWKHARAFPSTPWRLSSFQGVPAKAAEKGGKM